MTDVAEKTVGDVTAIRPFRVDVPVADGEVGIAHAHRAMWMNTIRDSLERSIPIAADAAFDDLLAQLDAIAAAPTKVAARDRRAPVSLVRRDAALAARLSGYGDLLASAMRGRQAQLKGA